MFTASVHHEDYWCPAGEGYDRSAPAISGSDWIALLKVANADWSVAAADLECLLERKLIAITSGMVRLTPQGQIALGLPV